MQEYVSSVEVLIYVVLKSCDFVFIEGLCGIFVHLKSLHNNNGTVTKLLHTLQGVHNASFTKTITYNIRNMTNAVICKENPVST